MFASRSAWVLGILSISFVCCISWKHSIIGVRGVLLLLGRGALVLGLSTWTVSYLYPRLRAAFSSRATATSEYVEVEEDKRKQRLVREELQKRHSEGLLKARQGSSIRKTDEQYYRMTGESWKMTEGKRLGGRELRHTNEGESSGTSPQAEVSGTSNQQAVRRRKVLESATRPEPPPEKRVVVLPDEPEDDAEGVVRVALKCPSGITIHRRFLKSHSSSVLLDWLLNVGYQPKRYTLCTSYPRRPLNTGEDISMEEAGILTHTVLNVEEKDPSTT